MILTRAAILENVLAGRITIDPFDPHSLNPNSYNYRLGAKLLRLAVPSTSDEDEHIVLPADGYRLEPGRIYLGSTVEQIGSETFAMSLLGRSSIGRLGLFLNISADLGHQGACSHWTLELTAVQPLIIYPGMSIGQVAFWRCMGKRMPYEGRYHHDNEPVPCRDRDLVRRKGSVSLAAQ
jgi:dCTP deaminase